VLRYISILVLCTKKTDLVPVAVSKKVTTTNETRKKRQTDKQRKILRKCLVFKYMNTTDPIHSLLPVHAVAYKVP
jgi:hypothetical protein